MDMTNELIQAFRQVCSSYRSAKATRTIGDLEPVWHFVETLGLSRLFGVERSTYDRIDQHIDTMGRGALIRLAFRGFINPSVWKYVQALQTGRIAPHAASMTLLRVRAAYDWIADNILLVGDADAELYDDLEHLRVILEAHYAVVENTAKTCQETRWFWRRILQQTVPEFTSSTYAALAA